MRFAMKLLKSTTLLAAVLVVAIAFTVAPAAAMAAPVPFTEDFTGPDLDPAWVQGGYAAGHIGIISGSYYMTAVQGGGGNPRLQRFDTGDANPLRSYTHEITVTLDPFFLTGSGGTQSDFKWKNFGPDGFMEVALNSFGDMRLFHNDFNGGGGSIQPNTNIGIAEGDVLQLTTAYDVGTDTIDVTYSLNGGGAVSFYSGGGIDGPIGNTIGDSVEAEVFKWGAVADVPYVAIDEWNLEIVPEPIPEPATMSLLALGGLLALRRRRS